MQDTPRRSKISDSRNWSALGAIVLVVVATIVAARGYGLPGLLALALGVTCAALGYFVGRNASPVNSAQPANNVAEKQSLNDAAARNLRDVISVLDLPAFVLDDVNSVVAANPGARDLFAEIAESRLLHQVSRHPGLMYAVQKARDTGTPQSCEISGHAPANRRFLGSISPLKSGETRDGKWRMLVQFRDLTEQDRLTQLRTDFIANASHELRTPLASIKGFVETLQGLASNDTVAREKFLGIMQSQAARMNRILDDLLSLSRIEMREHVPPSETIDLGSILRGTVDGLEPLARDARITLRYEPPTGTHRVRGDRDELVQVFQNLIQNAIKYGRENGNVEVALSSFPGGAGQPEKYVVRVINDGPGIADEHLPRLTERFYRVDTATSRERGGTGLGLAIVKHIVNRHRGELKITSKLGEGSSFSVILDAAS